MNIVRLPWLIILLTLVLLSATSWASVNERSLARLDSDLKSLGIANEVKANIIAIAEYEYYKSGEKLEIPTSQILRITEYLGPDSEDTLLLMTIKMIIQAYNGVDDVSVIDGLIDSEIRDKPAPLDLAYNLRENLELMGWDTGTAGQAIEALLRAADSGTDDDANIPAVGYSCCH